MLLLNIPILKVFVRRVLFFVPAFMLVLNHCHAHRPQYVAALENTALDSRQAIVSGHVELQSVQFFGKGHLAGKSRDTKCHVYFKNDRIRCDYTEEYLPLGNAKGHQVKHSQVSRSFSDGAFFFYNNQRFPSPNPAQIRSLDDSFTLAMAIPDPRKLGMVCGDLQLYKHFPLNYVCGNTQWIFLEDLGTEHYRGLECRKILYKRERLSSDKPLKDQTLTVWFSEERSSSIVGMLRKSKKRELTIGCDFQKIKGFGWFPSYVEFTAMDENELNRTEKVTVIVHHFNETIVDEFFDLSGMKVPVGWPVYDFRSDTELKMTPDGLEEVIHDVERSQIPKGMADSGSFRKILLIMNGIFVGCLAIYILWRRFSSTS